MKPGAGAAEKLSQAADADHMDQRAWQRENQIRGGIKSTGGRRSACAFCRISNADEKSNVCTVFLCTFITAFAIMCGKMT